MNNDILGTPVDWVPFVTDEQGMGNYSAPPYLALPDTESR